MEDSYFVSDLADTTNGLIWLTIHWFLSRLLNLSLQPFVKPFVGICLFLFVSKDRQTELATEVHEVPVVSRHCDHVPGLKDIPVKRVTRLSNTAVKKVRTYLQSSTEINVLKMNILQNTIA